MVQWGLLHREYSHLLWMPYEQCTVQFHAVLEHERAWLLFKEDVDADEELEAHLSPLFSDIHHNSLHFARLKPHSLCLFDPF